MKLFRRCQRILILSLLFFSVIVPIVFVSSRLKHLSSAGQKELVEDLSNIKYRTDNLKLKALQQEAAEGLKEPRLVVYEENDLDSAVSYGSFKEIHDSETSGNVRDSKNVLVGNRNGENDENGVGTFHFQQREMPYTSRKKMEI